jgi:uncharacterized protein
LIVPQVQITLGCNLSCHYCFQNHDDGTILDERTLKNVIDQCVAYNRKVLPQKNDLEILWHGGEPLLGGLDLFRKIVECESHHPGIKFQNKVQTNGVAMTDAFAEFLFNHDFQVGFSIDGPEETHNCHRVLGGGKEPSFRDTMRGIQNFRKYSQFQYLPVIAVITRHTLARGAKEFYGFFKALRASVQMDPYDLTCYDLMREGFRTAPSPYIPPPEEYGRFVMELFDLWFHDDPDQIDFVDLRNEMKILLSPEGKKRSIPDKKRCSPFRTIIDPRGRVFSCDQYVNDEHTALGNINEESLETIMDKKFKRWEEIKTFFRKDGNDFACHSCPYGDRCHGGCVTCMKYNYFTLKGYPLKNECKTQAQEVFNKYFSNTGDSMYCRAYRLYREHIEKCVTEEMARAAS